MQDSESSLRREEVPAIPLPSHAFTKIYSSLIEGCLLLELKALTSAKPKNPTVCSTVEAKAI